MVAEAARLRRAAARSGDLVPALRKRLPRYPSPRIDVDDRAAGKLGEVDLGAVGRLKHQAGQPDAPEVVRSAVVLRHRQVAREDVWIMKGRHARSPALR